MLSLVSKFDTNDKFCVWVNVQFLLWRMPSSSLIIVSLVSYLVVCPKYMFYFGFSFFNSITYTHYLGFARMDLYRASKIQMTWIRKIEKSIFCKVVTLVDQRFSCFWRGSKGNISKKWINALLTFRTIDSPDIISSNTLSANPTNGQIHSNNSLATAYELFECVWPFFRVSA